MENRALSVDGISRNHSKLEFLCGISTIKTMNESNGAKMAVSKLAVNVEIVNLGTLIL